MSVGINEALTQLRFGIAPAKNAATSPSPGQTTGADELAEDLAAFGLPVTAPPTEAYLDVWPENVAVFELWMALDLQWRRLVGTRQVAWMTPDHVNALAVMRALGVKKRDRRRVLYELCEMQLAAEAVLNAPE